jgi:hypothetical protein
MAPWWYKVAIFIFFVNSFIALFATPTFNIWDKHYSSPNIYFNKTNMSTSTMNATEASVYYGRDANVSTNASFSYTSIFNMNEAGVLGWLVAVFTIVVQLFTFVLNFAWQAYTFVGAQIIRFFGNDFIPIAVLIQGGINIGYTYGILQLLTARGGRVYD